MRYLFLPLIALCLAACAAPGAPGPAAPASGDLVAAPDGKSFSQRTTGRTWPPRGRPNR